ncbi:MAG TPA: hypothetical protein PLN56_00265 [Methanoregulaceae archaeon]|nr:hypothetical protein [Methanoregulaceae archaeon]HPD09421.1 hypothetical protein [Methanoregulaceae archaeon]HRT14786.1 hypothetical protein [Methanoregulaceae archaeon]HRU30359.1 hypothetical protein [Methanoregulaceae archaeon]
MIYYLVARRDSSTDPESINGHSGFTVAIPLAISLAITFPAS